MKNSHLLPYDSASDYSYFFSVQILNYTIITCFNELNNNMLQKYGSSYIEHEFEVIEFRNY